MLVQFDLKLEISSPPADEFIFKVASSQVTFLVGEGKDVKKLPQEVPPGMSHQLCHFGFATWLVTEYKPGQEELTRKLTERLGLPWKVGDTNKTRDASDTNETQAQEGKKKRDKPTLTLQSCSEAAQKLILDDEDSDFLPIANTIKDALKREDIGPHDANQLWGAVMQACIASVSKGIKYTMAMSAVNMWFIRLDRPRNGECELRISDPVAVGSPNSNLKLFKFLQEAKSDGNLTEEERNAWQQALIVVEKPGNRQIHSTAQEGGTDGETSSAR